MEDSEFYNLSSEAQTRHLQSEAAVIVNYLSVMAQRLKAMGRAASAMDIERAIDRINEAMGDDETG